MRLYNILKGICDAIAVKDVSITYQSGYKSDGTAVFKDGRIAYVKVGFSSSTSSAVTVTNGTVIATGFPIPESGPWTFVAHSGNAANKLRVAVNTSGQLIAYWPGGTNMTTVPASGYPLIGSTIYKIKK